MHTMRNFKLGGIPLALTEEHHEVYRAWQKLRGATLLHVDAHSDHTSGALATDPLDPHYWTFLNCANFILPAVGNGIISRFYWLNPHVPSRQLQDLGATDGSSTRSLYTAVTDSRYHWSYQSSHLFYAEPCGTRCQPDDLVVTHPFILDIDLDAFCCDNNIFFSPWGYDGVKGFDERIRSTTKILRHLPRPDLITVTRSQGVLDVRETYVPPTLVETVQEQCLEALAQLYARRTKPMPVSSRAARHDAVPSLAVSRLRD